MNSIERASAWYGQADARRWQCARIAYGLKRRSDRLKLADAIGRGEDTVDNLVFAYSLFVELIANSEMDGSDSEPIRKLRRRFPYTRWAVVFRQWNAFEFDLSEAKDWLENFDGGNDAMSREIKNKHGAPEWERRLYSMYKLAGKLVNDFGVPDRMQKVSELFVTEYDIVFPKVKK